MAMRNDPRGSIWRKWDLHIHTPASFHWTGKRFTGESVHDETVLAEMVHAMNAADAEAFCIMDYWTFDGWFALQAYLTRHAGELTKTVFPGIELRLEAPTNFRLNTHFLFDDALTDQQLREFLATLKIAFIDRSPSYEAFGELGRTFDSGKLAKHGFKQADRSDNERMANLGAMTAKISRDSWRAACSKLQDRLVIIQPYDTSDGLEGLDWKRHPYDDAELMSAAHFYETRNLDHIKLFLGVGLPDKAQLSEDFFRNMGGRWKPVVSGSDAHRFEDYGAFPEGKASWIKADTTFAGLRQCMADPVGRVFIGSEPPKLRHQADNSTKYMSRLRIHKRAGDEYAEKWFTCDIPLNPGMIAIIGNKGCGKSALADIMALAGNSHCTSFEFLNDRRFRKPGDNKAAHFEAVLTWSNGDEVTVALNDVPKLDQPERVRYLPQQYLELLCTEPGTEGQTKFEQELRKVMFSHVPIARRLGLSTLDELVSYRTEQVDEHASDLRHQLSGLNSEIASLEKALMPESISAVKSQIELRETELQAHLLRKPPEVVIPVARGEGTDAALVDAIDVLRGTIEASRSQLSTLRERQLGSELSAAAASRLVQRIRNLEKEIRRAWDDAGEDALTAGIVLSNVIKFEVNVSALAERHEALENEAREVTLAVDAEEKRLGIYLEQLADAQEQASEPERIYQEYLALLEQWQRKHDEIVGAREQGGTLEGLRARVVDLESRVPERLRNALSERDEVARQLYNVVRSKLEVFRELSAPIAAAANGHHFLRELLRVEFNVVVEGIAFADRLLALLNQGRRGTFYGQAEGADAARKLAQSAQLASWEGVQAFLKTVMDALTIDQREGRQTPVQPASQLRDGVTISDMYDLIFGLDYLRPRLTLQLGGKEVGELSPGERGILLLVFYLLLDREEIPLVIDQPEHNLDNASVFGLLEPCIRRAKNRRQIVLVTHNPNVAIVCDAEEVISADIDKQDGYRITYKSGAIENPELNLDAVNVLEGTWPAFDARDAAYQRPAVV
jgi:ABC-type lipoprotein export system ATPase subunit